MSFEISYEDLLHAKIITLYVCANIVYKYYFQYIYEYSHVSLYIFIYVFAGSDNVADSTCTIKSSLHIISLTPSNAILGPSNFSLQSFTTDDHSSSLDIIDKVTYGCLCIMH